MLFYGLKTKINEIIRSFVRLLYINTRLLNCQNYKLSFWFEGKLDKKTMEKPFLIISIVVVGVILLIAAFMLMNNQVSTVQPTPSPTVTLSPSPSMSPSPTSGIEVTLPAQNALITSPVTIKGTTHGNGWIGFEGQVGTVKLFNSSNVQLGSTAILTAVGNWMQTDINFQTTLTFVSPGSGTGKLVFYNENPSGDPLKDQTFTVNVTFN